MSGNFQVFSLRIFLDPLFFLTLQTPVVFVTHFRDFCANPQHSIPLFVTVCHCRRCDFRRFVKATGMQTMGWANHRQVYRLRSTRHLKQNSRRRSHGVTNPHSSKPAFRELQCWRLQGNPCQPFANPLPTVSQTLAFADRWDRSFGSCPEGRIDNPFNVSRGETSLLPIRDAYGYLLSCPTKTINTENVMRTPPGPVWVKR